MGVRTGDGASIVRKACWTTQPKGKVEQGSRQHIFRDRSATRSDDERWWGTPWGVGNELFEVFSFLKISVSPDCGVSRSLRIPYELVEVNTGFGLGEPASSL